VLVADLPHAASRDFLTGVALAGGKACLPLITAPCSASTHLIEVYTPDSAEPLVFFADPLGPPTAGGYPLRLRIYELNAPRQRASEDDVTEENEPSSMPSHMRELRARVPAISVAPPQPCGFSGEVRAVAPEALVGRSLAGGKLTIEELIGAGGVGCVYRASHRDLRLRVAVKVLHHDFQQDPEFCRRFHSEALAASRLDHPNLMRVLDFGQEPDGLLYLAMEHLDGRALADTLDAGGTLSLPRIVGIMTQVCSGLGHAHARGIVHRDVKPANVVLVTNLDDDERPEEVVKVCDFGIAVAPADGEDSSVLVGTPAYMSPEQCRGEVLDGRSDIYSCGVMLYELATGKMPFDAPTPVEMLQKQIYEKPLEPSRVAPGVDPRLEAIILKALAKDAAKRQESMRELRRDLRGVLGGEGGASSLPSPSTTPPGPVSEEQPRSTASTTAVDTRPDWIERGGALADVDVHGRLLAGELAARPAPWLAAFAAATQAEQFDTLARRLDGALPLLAGERNFKALFAVRRTLDALAVDDGHQAGWRVARARALQLACADPQLLTALAEAALTSDHSGREVYELLVRAGTPAMYALYSARLKLHDLPGVRRRFVLFVREVGAEALPMIRAGLARLEARRNVPVAAALAYDLFEASPHVLDDEAGEVTVRYLQDTPRDVTRVAAQALVWFWRARAKPRLLGLLACDDEGIVIASMNGLRELGIVDEYTVTCIVVAARATRSAEVRNAARWALRQSAGKAYALAQRALRDVADDEQRQSATAGTGRERP
jgi:eukaryotic-like serine/threonine-protein kinase